jgi:hypothetical protein
MTTFADLFNRLVDRVAVLEHRVSEVERRLLETEAALTRARLLARRQGLALDLAEEGGDEDAA